MKLTDLSRNIQQTNFRYFQPGKDTVRESANMLINCASVYNSSECFFNESGQKAKHADVIKDFFRKVIAAQSYNRMFANGSDFKNLGIELAKPSTDKASLYALKHLNQVSNDYLTKIKEKTQNLTVQEKILLGKVVDAKLHFRHQSNSNLASGKLNIMSFHKLQSTDVRGTKNTYPEDLICLSNHDFVFFGVEFSGDKSQLPLNTRHTKVDYGANAYILDDQFPYGYLTLTDHFFNTIPPASTHEHQHFFSRFSAVRKDIRRKVHGEKGIKDVPIYNTKDMRLALGLHLIDFLRNSSDAGFKKFALNENLESKDLDKIINFVFQPEFHVPRMVSTTNFKEVKLRKISAEEAVKASNFEALSEHIKNKNQACIVMGLAIQHARKDIVNYLFSNISFTREDVIQMSSLYDTEYLLSNYSSDENILELFLQHRLVDPNKKFTKINRGYTMLDQAIKYKKQGLIDVLLSYGAVYSKDLSKTTEICQ